MAATHARNDRRGLLTRLRRDTAGNTLAIMAAALLPLCAFAGSAVDVARLYVVKVRLQQACDAGALAGRKFLPNGEPANVNIASGSVASTDTTADANGRTLAADGAQALTYFNNNMETSWLSASWFTASTDKFSAQTFTDTKGNTQVQGNATARVPMTLMQMFGMNASTLSVQCQASFSTPDTDVMFVLDTTGTMGCGIQRPETTCDNGYLTTQSNIVNGSSGPYVAEESANGGSRVAALRAAVLAFYDTVSTSKDSSTRVRYGFVPFTATVNVGTLLYGMNTGNLVNTWTYQSRTPVAPENKTKVSSKTVTASTQAACLAYASRSPAYAFDGSVTDANVIYPNNGTATSNDPSWTPQTGNGSGSGTGNQPATCTLTTNQDTPNWGYQPVKYDVSNFLKGGSMVDPSKVDGSKTTWNGCVEERDTVAGGSGSVPNYNSASALYDLDPDLVPSSDNTRWRPVWPSVEYVAQYRQYGLSYDNSALSMLEVNSCPAQVVPLFLPADTASGRTVINNYVNGLKAMGYTYHDVGMIWGNRLLSPTGLWSSNNNWPLGRIAPKRILIFVTDGYMEPNSNAYSAYGVENMDRRVTGSYFGSNDPNAGLDSNNQCTNTSANCYSYWHSFHEARFAAECNIAKQKLGFDVWVIEVAQASSTALTNCASRPSQVLPGTDAAKLASSFQQIAAQVAMLRVTQ